MKVAALDLGTNTFLCLIAEGGRQGIERVVLDETETVRLGQGIDRDGAFHPEALVRARACLTRFRQLMDRHGVDQVRGVATSAARDAKNGAELFAMAEDLGIPLHIVEGEVEARLSYEGVCGDFVDQDCRVIIDIGGGSTELILGRGRERLFSKSLDIGAVRLTERYIATQPVPAGQAAELDACILSAIRPVVEAIREKAPGPVRQLLAVAGTPTSLAAVELGGFDPKRVEGHRITRERLREWREVFATCSVEEKKRTYGLGGRADIIYAGVSILCHLAEAFQHEDVVVSVKGLRYGVALELLARS